MTAEIKNLSEDPLAAAGTVISMSTRNEDGSNMPEFDRHVQLSDTG
jgi:hypothetical protein